MPDLHAKISPSSFKRVRLCPGSLNYVEALLATGKAVDEDSPAAREGTARHEAVERMLDGEHLEAPFTAENGIVLDRLGLDDAEVVFDWIVEQEFDRIWNEVRVPVGEALGLNDPDLCWGTSDVVAIKGSSLYVIDAKFGRVDVSPKGNDQALLYALGVIRYLQNQGEPTKFDLIHNVIIQPKAGGVKQAEVTPEELEDYRKLARAAIETASGSDAPLVPGEEQCRFCPASGVCTAQLHDEFEALTEDIDVDDISNERMAELLDQSDHILATIKSLKTAALQRLAAGQKIPGWVREQGNGRAKWIDEDDVVTEIEAHGLELDDYAPRRPATQTDLRKALGDKIVESLITRPPGEVKLVREEEAKNPLDSEFSPL